MTAPAGVLPGRAV